MTVDSKLLLDKSAPDPCIPAMRRWPAPPSVRSTHSFHGNGNRQARTEDRNEAQGVSQAPRGVVRAGFLRMGPSKEVDLLGLKIRELGQPALELGSGTGKILIPLLEQGLKSPGSTRPRT